MTLPKKTNESEQYSLKPSSKYYRNSPYLGRKRESQNCQIAQYIQATMFEVLIIIDKDVIKNPNSRIKFHIKNWLEMISILYLGYTQQGNNE